jgi:hypothetical protein
MVDLERRKALLGKEIRLGEKVEGPFPWDECPEAWPTKSKYFGDLRGECRGIWKNSPIRTSFIREMSRPVTSKEGADKVFHTQTKSVCQCVFCDEWFPKSKVDVDHKVSSNGCTNWTEAEEFFWYCVAPKFEELQIACKACHIVKTQAERKGITFEEAHIEVKVTQIMKAEGKQLKDALAVYGYSKKDMSNGSKRRDCVRELVIAGTIQWEVQAYKRSKTKRK